MSTSAVRRFASAALFVLSCAAGAVHAEIRLSDPIPIGPQVQVGKLANGLTYYIQRNRKPENRLELRLVVKAGSILEDEDQRGLAHFTEHLAFNGSRHFKKHELISYLQSVGVKFGADLNAYTSFDETVYILPIPSDNKEALDKAFLVLEDWAHGLTLDDAAIDAERGIVLEELRLGKGAQDRMNKVLLPKIFNGSRYAERLPIGKEEVISKASYDTVRRFYRDWYRPDLMAVVVVGDIDPKEAEARIRSHFAALKNPPKARPRTYAPIPRREDTEAVVVTDKEATGNAVLLRYPLTEKPPRLTFGAYRDSLIEGLFSAMLNQRLAELAQQPEPPYLGAGSGINRLTPRYQSYFSTAGLAKGGAGPAVDALMQENARARKYGFSAAELDRAKRNVLRQYERQWNERDKTESSSFAAEYIRNFLMQEEIPGIDNEYRYVQELLPGISLDELNAYARKTIPDQSGKLVVYMGNANAETPTSEQLLASVLQAEKKDVQQREEKALAQSLMAKKPAPGAIVAETQDAALGLTRLTLSNGVKVILKPTDFKNDQVLLSASRRGGQSLFETPELFNVRYAGAVSSVMGLGEFTPIEVQKILSGKTASINLGIGDYSENVGGNSGSADIETMLQLVYLKFTGVRRDEALYRSFMAKQLEQVRNVLAQPEAVFQDTVTATLYDNNPRVGRVTRPEDLAKVDLDRSIAAYRARFGSAKDMTFILVGSFDVAAVKPLIATYLATLPTPDIPTDFRDVGVRPVKGVVKKEVRMGSEPKSQISLNFTGPATYSDEEWMRLSALMEVMNIRIIDIIREKMGLIYGGGMHANLTPYPYGHYSITASLPTSPANVDKVLAAVFAEIERMKTEGPDEADLNKVKQNWLQNYKRAMRENNFWLQRLQSALWVGSDPARILKYEQELATVKPQDLQTLAKRYFTTDNYVQVVLYPEK